MRLAVELYGHRIGTISGDARTFDLRPDPSAIERLGLGSTILSVAMPLVPAPRRDHAGRRRAWFEGLLPEGDQLDHLLAASGVRRGDVPGFLARYGRDVAGAVEIWDLDDPTEPREPSAVPLDAAQVRALLDDPAGAPLGNALTLGKTSLAGVQPKIALARTDSGWAQALGGYPTTHILKPHVEARPTLIGDEEYGLRLARSLGLLPFSAQIESFAGRAALVVERFDRSPSGERIHQEDFAQALGATGAAKYQRFGDGRASLSSLARILKANAPAADLVALARRTVFGVGIADLDAHAKNHGLLHPDDGSTRLAPAYDLVPHSRLPGSDGEVALAVARTYRHAGITAAMLTEEILGWGVRRAERIVRDTLDELLAATLAELPHPSADERLQRDIIRTVRNLAAGEPAGTPA